MKRLEIWKQTSLLRTHMENEVYTVKSFHNYNLLRFNADKIYRELVKLYYFTTYNLKFFGSSYIGSNDIFNTIIRRRNG